MADTDFINETGSVPAKKRRLANACDACRRKKVKCDSATKEDGFCTNCIQSGLTCTHGEPVKKRGPKTGGTYVQELEQRVNNLEAILQEIKPDALSGESEGFAMYNKASSPGSSLTKETWAAVSRDATPPFANSSSDSSPSPNAGIDTSVKLEDEDDSLADHLAQLSITGRFFGASSTFALAKSAMDLRSEYGGYSNVLSASQHQGYWSLQPWESVTAERHKPHYVFPPKDLMDHLVQHYFERVHLYIPIFHKPTFIESVRQGLYLVDTNFGGVLLLVLATGARYSNDPRVLSPGDTTKLSAGWQWFEQVNVINSAIYYVPTVYTLQSCVLMIIYSLGTSVPQTSWTMLGVGLRFAVEIGIHRRKPDGHKATLEDEVKKRVFWALLCLDRMICLFLGRPSIIRDEDFDLDLPEDCDDEYWSVSPTTGELSFHQPLGVPSKLAFFIQQLKLIEILAFVLRSIYSIKKSKIMLGITGKDWEQRVVSDLDSALNKWRDQVPDHLCWDPHQQNKAFLVQSVTLFELYYLTQIQIHRPFIHTDSPLSFSSLAMCTNAARSCCHITDTVLKIVGVLHPYSMFSSFICGLVLSINIWSAKRSRLALNLRKETVDVGKCLEILKVMSHRWNVAGRLWEMLKSISVFADDLPDHSLPTRKRSRDVAGLSSVDVGTNVSSFSSLQSATDGFIYTPLDESLINNLTNIFAPDSSSNTNFNFAPLGNEAVDMWSAAPTGFSWEEWGSYIDQTDTSVTLT